MSFGLFLDLSNRLYNMRKISIQFKFKYKLGNEFNQEVLISINFLPLDFIFYILKNSDSTRNIMQMCKLVIKKKFDDNIFKLILLFF